MKTKKLYVLLLTAGLCLTPTSTFAQAKIVERKSTSTHTTKKVTPISKKKTDNARKAPRLQEPTGRYSTEYLSDESITVNGVTFVMKGVQGGVFTMGATPEQERGGSTVYGNERPVHRVAVSSFRIGQTEVTQQLWQAVMGTNPSKFKDGDYPVMRVSWDDCQDFINRLNGLTGRHFRLPTEAEWEYAARGGNQSRGYKYSGSNDLDDVGWYCANSLSESGLETLPHYIARKAPNELGLYDMSGNAMEWCQDGYGSYSSKGQTNPTGPSSAAKRVYRGGAYTINDGGCRVSIRGGLEPYDNGTIGLRLAL